MKNIILILTLILIGSCDYFKQKPLKKKIPEDQVSYGKELVQSYGCTSCHIIPGMVGNPADLGPDLSNWSKRKYIAGEVPNRHKELSTWLMKPHAIDPQTTMPNLGISEKEAHAIATFLHTLGEETP